MRRAEQVIPGGVNSPVRAFKGVGGTPVFFESAAGAYLVDVDGNRYIDYVASWGPMIQGHGFAPVVEAVRAQASASLGFGAPTRLEIAMAEKIVEAVPGIEKVRLVNSGTEATMSAIRLARGYSGRDLLIKFDGCYHGHSDALLVKAGSGVLTLGLPNSPGVPESVARHTLTLPFNGIEAARAAFERYGADIACVILEPVAGNMGCIPPAPGFLEALRTLTAQAGAVLIFDEVMTGFRVARGGAQERFGVTPGSHDSRQGHRRRAAGGRLRRPGGHHGLRGARRPGLPGRDAVRQSAGDHGRSRHAGLPRCPPSMPPSKRRPSH